MENNNEFQVKLKKAVKDDIKEYFILYLFISFILSFVIAIIIGILAVIITAGNIEQVMSSDESGPLFLFLLISISYICSWTLIRKYVKGLHIKRVENEMNKKQLSDEEKKDIEKKRISEIYQMSSQMGLTNEEINKAIKDNNSELLNDYIDFKFALDVLGYSKEDAMYEIRKQKNNRYILEVRRLFMWAGDIYGMSQQKCLEIYNDLNRRNAFFDEYYRFCDMYQAGLQAQILSSLEAEINERTLRSNVNQPSITGTPLSSGLTEFIGLDGQLYTKDEFGYNRKKGSSEIIGQNGYDKDGHRLEYYN